MGSGIWGKAGIQRNQQTHKKFQKGVHEVRCSSMSSTSSAPSSSDFISVIASATVYSFDVSPVYATPGTIEAKSNFDLGKFRLASRRMKRTSGPGFEQTVA